MQLYYKPNKDKRADRFFSVNRTVLKNYTSKNLFFYTIGQDSNPNNASKARKTKQRKYITAKYVPHSQTYETVTDLVLTEPTGLYNVR